MPSPQCPKGHFRVLYFASAASYTKKESEHIEAPLESSRLFDKLNELYPGMKEKVLSSCAVTRNLQYIDLEDEADKVTISEGDEIGIIPPGCSLPAERAVTEHAGASGVQRSRMFDGKLQKQHPGSKIEKHSTWRPLWTYGRSLAEWRSALIGDT